MFKIYKTVLKVGEKSLIYIALDDVTNNIKGFTVKFYNIFQTNKIFLLCFVLKSDSREVDCRHFYRTNFQCSSADRVEVTEVFDIRFQTAAVRKRCNTIINKDIRVIPFHIVRDTPTSEIFVYELSIFSQKRNGKNGVCKHIVLSNISNNLHKHFLELFNFVKMVNHECSIWEFRTTKECFEVWTIEYRNVGKCGLNTITNIWLVYCIDKALNVLARMVIGSAHVVSFFNVLFPEIIEIRNEVRQTASTGTPIRHKANILFNKINKSLKVPWCLIVERIEEEQAFFC